MTDVVAMNCPDQQVASKGQSDGPSRDAIAGIDVMIITFNEELNLPHCIEALEGWTNNIFVIDSGSTDATVAIAKQNGAKLIHHDWEGYAQQKNWALDNLPFESQWILIVDADEVITSQVRARLVTIAERPVDDVEENGFFINRLTYFLGKPIRHCGYYPSWNLRFFKRGAGRYEERPVHEHVMIDNPVGRVREPMLHEDRRGLEHYIAKHNRYSTLEARALFDEMTGRVDRRDQANLASQTKWNRWMKRNITPHLPFPALLRFLYMYILRLGILDGRVGFQFCNFIGMYDRMVALKLGEMRRENRRRSSSPGLAADDEAAKPQPGVGTPALAIAEGDDPVVLAPSTEHEAASPAQLHPEASPWTLREKIGRAIWMLVGKPAFRISFHNWYRYRATLLRMFGATVGSGVAIRPTVNIEVPWMIELQDDCTIGDHAILYSLGKITIGKRAIISQYAHLCAGTHDYADHTFRLIRTPVAVGDDVWIGADAFIGPGVNVGDLSVVGARSSVYKSIGQGEVYVGNPARALKERVLH